MIGLAETSAKFTRVFGSVRGVPYRPQQVVGDTQKPPGERQLATQALTRQVAAGKLDSALEAFGLWPEQVEVLFVRRVALAVLAWATGERWPHWQQLADSMALAADQEPRALNLSERASLDNFAFRSRTRGFADAAAVLSWVDDCARAELAARYGTD